MPVLLLCMSATASAQSYTWDDFVQEYTDEQLADDDYSQDGGTYDGGSDQLRQYDVQLQELRPLHDHPLNINSATHDELLRLPFLSDGQIEEIHAYIYLHGPLQSQGELRLVPGLDARTRRFLSLFITFGQEQPKGSAAGRLFAPVRNTISSRTDIPLYYRRGYLVKDGYAGDALYHRTRYQLRGGKHLRLGGYMEKDAGERWADAWGVYAELKQVGILRAAVAGDYRMGFGEGLVVGGSSWYARTVPPVRVQSGLRASTGTDEVRFLRGAAATMALGRQAEVSVFASARQLDATLNDDGSIRTLLTTGLHRTSSERLRHNNVGTYVCGGDITWSHSGWHLGVAGYFQQYDRTLNPGDQPYRRYYPRGKRFGNVGIHYGKSLYRLSVAGETAVSTSASAQSGMATLHRITWRPGARYTISAVQRYYAPSYVSMQASTFSSGSRVQNENGLLLHLKAEPWDLWQMLAYADFVYRPWPPYGCSVSQSSQQFQYQLLHSMGSRHTLSVRYSMRHTADDEHKYRHRLRMQWTCQPSAVWRMQTSAQLLRTLSGTGYSVQQAVRLFVPSPSLLFSVAAGYSDAGSTKSALSEYLPTLVGSMGQTFFYGQNLHAVLLGRWTSRSGMFRLEGRYAMRRVFGSSIQGSGLQTIYSPWRNDLSFQLTIRC